MNRRERREVLFVAVWAMLVQFNLLMGPSTASAQVVEAAKTWPDLTAEMAPAKQLYDAKKVDDAASKLRALLEKNPGHPEVQYLLGLCYMQVGMVPEMFAAWEGTMGSDPAHGPARQDYVKARYNLAKIQVRQGKSEEAMEHLSKGLAADSKHGKSHYLLGQIYASKENWVRTIDEYKLALADLGDNASLWNALGAAYSKNKQFEESRKALEKALELDPNNDKAKKGLEQLQKLGY